MGVRKKLSNDWRVSVSAKPYFLIERDEMRHRFWLNTVGASYRLSEDKTVSLTYVWIPRVDSDREIHVVSAKLDFDFDMRTLKRTGKGNEDKNNRNLPTDKNKSIRNKDTHRLPRVNN